MPVDVLLVEPHHAVNMAFKKAIANTKYRVTLEAETGEEALEKYRTGRPRPGIVVMDMIFPGLGGIGTTEELLKLDPQVCVVLIHDKKSAFRVMEGTKKGARGNVRYPFGSNDKVLEQMAIAEQGGGAGALGSEDHFARVTRPLAVLLKKRGFFGLFSGQQSGYSERLSVNKMVVISEKPYKPGTGVNVQIVFQDGQEVVQGKIGAINEKNNLFEITVDYHLKDKDARERFRKHILTAATKE